MVGPRTTSTPLRRASLAAAATALGTLPVLFAQNFTKRTYDCFLGFGAGVMQHMADIEAIHTYEGTESVQALLLGRDITGVGAFA